ncbi:MAG: enoyl-CoA hydratase/isomerase family protein [Myxococcota bacterium]
MNAVPTLLEARGLLAGMADPIERIPGTVRVTDDGLVLENPEARGAITVHMMVELADAVLAWQEACPAVVVVRGSGPGVFCSGGHLGQVRASLLDPESGERMSRCMTAVLDGLACLPAVVVMWVDGPALGGGAEVLTAGDAVFVGPSARIGFVHARLGVVPGWGGATRLTRALGPRQALELLASAPVLGPEEAVRTGLARGDLDAGERFLAEVRSRPADAVRAAKRQVLAACPLVRDGQEATLFGEVWGSPTHRACLDRG